MHPSRLAGSRRRLWSGITLLAVAAAALAACSTSTSGAPVRTVTATPTSSGSGSASSSPSSATSSYSGPVSTVHVSSLESDGQTYGVGMPIVLLFSPAPTDSSAFTKAVTVTVNGQPAGGAWFWEQPTADEKKSNSIEAHYRPQHYWQADSSVHVDIPIGGLSAGRGLVFSDKLTSLDIKIGDAHVATVNATTLAMTVTANGNVVKTIPVSLGAAATPTYNGVKVVMQKGEDTPGTNTLRPSGAVRMVGPGYDEIVSWSVRVTRSGEYVHAAPWNSRIGQASTSNGCTNLSTADAQWYYNFAQIGDVVQYSGTTGTKMPSWDGFGDWNVPWGQWAQGGLLLNH